MLITGRDSVSKHFQVKYHENDNVHLFTKNFNKLFSNTHLHTLKCYFWSHNKWAVLILQKKIHNIDTHFLGFSLFTPEGLKVS